MTEATKTRTTKLTCRILTTACLAILAVAAILIAPRYFAGRAQDAAIVRLGSDNVRYEHEVVSPLGEISSVEAPGTPLFRSLLGDGFYFVPHAVRLDRGDVTNDDVRQTLSFRTISELTLAGSAIDDDVGHILAQLRNLESLDVSHTHITDKCLMAIGRLPRLRTLDISGTNISDSGVEYLSSITSLETLLMYEDAVGDECLKNLKPLTQLRWIGLTGTKVTGKGFQHLREHRALTKLYASGCECEWPAIEFLFHRL